MLYIHDTEDISLDVPSVVTIGKFDGWHRGHRKLLRAAAALKGEGEVLVVFTFSRSPQMFLAGKQGEELNDHEEKLRMAEALGVDVLIEYPFSEAVRHMEAEVFLEEILCRGLRAKHIAAGPDCRFGYQRRGDARFLQEREKAFGYRFHIIDKEVYQGEEVSSSRIRRALEQGQLRDANRMLGYAYGYRGEVLTGNRIGRKLGFPTINQQIPSERLVPAYGVYASRVKVDGVFRPAVSNVGVKPTVPGEYRRGLETCILDYSGDLYGRVLETELLDYIRPERKFESLEELRLQVEEDKRRVREGFAAGEYHRDPEKDQIGGKSYEG